MSKETFKPFLIGICGGSASGKTSAADLIINYLGQENCLLFSLDNYFYGPNDEERKHIEDYNFDRPEALDLDLAYRHLSQLRNGESIEMPVYNFNISKRLSYTQKVSPKKIIIFEGIFALYEKRMRDLMDLKLFFDLDSDIRLYRRISRDISDRSRVLETVLDRYLTFVKPAFDIYIQPTRKYVDLVSPQGTYNSLLVEIVSEYLSYNVLNTNKIQKHISKDNIKFSDSFDFNSKEFFSNPGFTNLIMVKDEKDIRKFNKIINYLITKRNSSYYDIYIKTIISDLIKMANEDNKENLETIFLDESNFLTFKEAIKSKLTINKNNKIIIHIFFPMLISKDEKIKENLVTFINELKNFNVKFKILSVYLSEQFFKILDNGNEVNFITIYFGDNLFNNVETLNNGGFIKSNPVDIGLNQFISKQNLIVEYERKKQMNEIGLIGK